MFKLDTLSRLTPYFVCVHAVTVVADMASKRLERSPPEIIQSGLAAVEAAQQEAENARHALCGGDGVINAPPTAMQSHPSEPASGAACGERENGHAPQSEHSEALQASQPAGPGSSAADTPPTEVISIDASTPPTEVVSSPESAPDTEVQRPRETSPGADGAAAVSAVVEAPEPADAVLNGPSIAAQAPEVNGPSPQFDAPDEAAVTAGAGDPLASAASGAALEADHGTAAEIAARSVPCTSEPGPEANDSQGHGQGGGRGASEVSHSPEAGNSQDPGQGVGDGTIEEAHLPLQLVMCSDDEMVNATSPSRSQVANVGFAMAPPPVANPGHIVEAEGELDCGIVRVGHWR